VLWLALSDNGLKFVERNYSPGAGRERLRRMLARLDALRWPGRKAVVSRRSRKSASGERLRVSMVDSCDEYRARQGLMLDEQVRRQALEAGLVPGRRPFTVGGYCYTCGKRSRFLVDFRFSPEDARVPNWRESLVCWRCRLNNRTRAAVHLFEEVLRPGLDDTIYVTEQCSRLYKWLHRHYPRVTGSEYLGDSAKPGTSNKQGIRNESVTGLSFPDGSFNHILSFDVFEHVPDYRVALAECLRCLKPGGTLLFSVPFRRDRAENLERARVHENGHIEHMLPAEYHGDPMNSAGCLCFWHFGWALLDEMREAGFARASACMYWSAELGYLGGEQIAFVGFKA
jgi:SAM-dependent methyltransferase